MTEVDGRRILLGVTGSIAAFKAATLASDLTKAGGAVRVILTSGAERFVTAETFAALTKEPVSTSLWGSDGTKLDHLDLGRWADIVVVAPASAHTIARMALGLADDLLTTTLLATRSPILIAPAMESQMYDHPAIQAHLATLESRGVRVTGPVEGRLASGSTGAGRMVEPADILLQIRRRLTEEQPTQSSQLAGLRLVVTAGPTHEPIDPVRFVSNRSSGKMGYALARAAAERAADVVLISGPVDEAVSNGLPSTMQRINVETAEEMRQAVLKAASDAKVIVMAAAVADFRPAEPAHDKIKRSSTMSSISLEPTVDILTELKAAAPRALRIGFAAETGNVIDNAAVKLRSKGLAMVVANEVAAVDHPVFGADTNRVTIIRAAMDPVVLPLLSKDAVARRILDEVEAELAKQPE